MGVTNLWKLVDKYKSTVKLNELRGKYVAIDLSTWIAESNQKFKSLRDFKVDSKKDSKKDSKNASKNACNNDYKNGPNDVYKPYLRILYQRISRLIKCGVIPFVVADSYKINKLKLNACEQRYTALSRLIFYVLCPYYDVSFTSDRR